MIQALRLQAAGLIVLLFVIISYFSAKRRKTNAHKIFSIMLATGVINIVTDFIVNYYYYAKDTFLPWVNKIYLASIMAVTIFLLIYLVNYVFIDDSARRKNILTIAQIVFIIAFLVLMISKMEVQPSTVSLTFGIGVITMYSVNGAYIALFLYFLVRNWKTLDLLKRMSSVFAISSILLSYILQFSIQGYYVTGLGVAFTILCLYLMTENPDQLLIEQLQYEKERADAANASKSSFIAHISHEIRTPINAILGMDDMIMRETKEEDTKACAQDINVAANSLYSIINDVLDMSKLDSGKMDILPVKYNLNQMIYEAISLNQARIDAKHLDFYVDVNPTLPIGYYGDDVRIKQVLGNILSNAIKYTHEGFVRLTVDGNYRGELMELTFSVKDTGIGIKEEDIDRLFVAFERIEESRNRNIEGTGLGMNITNNLLRMMGSKLNVSSVYGEGSIFSFSVMQRITNSEPVGDYSAFSKEKREAVSLDFKAPDVKILIVDDNTLNRRVFISLLKDTKMVIHEAESGFKCLDMIKNEAYDLIFLDHLMPEMDGVDTLQKIRSSKDHLCLRTPVIMLTANDVNSMQSEYQKAGFDACLSKPVFAVDLERIINNFVPSYKVVVENTPSPDKRKPGGKEWKEELPSIRGIDWKEAFKHLPTEDALYATLKEFHRSIEPEAAVLDKCFDNLDDMESLELFRIKTHALKSSAALIGAEMLSSGAKEIEEAAKNNNFGIVREKYPYMIKYYRTFIEKLAMFDNGPDTKKKKIDFPQVLALVEMVKLEMDDMNKDNALEALDEINQYEYPEDILKDIRVIQNAVENFEADLVSDLTDDLLTKLRRLKVESYS